MLEHVMTYWFWYIYPVGSMLCALAIVAGKMMAQKDKDFEQLYVCYRCEGKGKVPDSLDLSDMVRWQYVPCPDCSSKSKEN